MVVRILNWLEGILGDEDFKKKKIKKEDIINLLQSFKQIDLYLLNSFIDSIYKNKEEISLNRIKEIIMKTVGF